MTFVGFEVCDFEETILDCSKYWREFNDGRTSHERRIECLREAFQNFDVCMDAPCYIYWQELMQAFPEAKCIFYNQLVKIKKRQVPLRIFFVEMRFFV